MNFEPSSNPVSELDYVYKNIRTGVAREFGFRRTRIEWIWDLVDAKGAVIGQWNHKLRKYFMIDGLSNHVILRKEPTGALKKETIREWISIIPPK